MSARVTRVTFPIENELALYECAAIEHEGRIWLVPSWLPGEGYTRPERMIPLDQFPHQVIETAKGDLDVMINSPVPRALIDGPLSPELIARFGVLERPYIKLRMAPGALS